MKLQFLGATRQVTGSRYCLEAGGAKVLIDCGMFQERQYRERNWEPSPVAADEIDAVVLTHAHLDHCGLTPKLVKEGFRGPILATPASGDLAEVILHDSAEILPDSMFLLQEAAQILKERTDIGRVEVQGHTDNTGTPAYNKRLSGERANAVRDALIELGVSSARLTAKGYGQDRPLVANTSDANRAKNRRVQLIRLRN